MAFTMFGRTIRKIGIIGSGNIGPDNRSPFQPKPLFYGVPVVVVDIVRLPWTQAQKGPNPRWRRLLKRGLSRKRRQMPIFKNMLFTTDYGQLSDADLIVEAAFEEKTSSTRSLTSVKPSAPKQRSLPPTPPIWNQKSFLRKCRINDGVWSSIISFLRRETSSLRSFREGNRPSVDRISDEAL